MEKFILYVGLNDKDLKKALNQESIVLQKEIVESELL